MNRNMRWTKPIVGLGVVACSMWCARVRAEIVVNRVPIELHETGRLGSLSDLIAFDDKLFFGGVESPSGEHLFWVDGNEVEGRVLNPDGIAFVAEFTPFGDDLVFQAFNETDRMIMSFNGGDIQPLHPQFRIRGTRTQIVAVDDVLYANELGARRQLLRYQDGQLGVLMPGLRVESLLRVPGGALVEGRRDRGLEVYLANGETVTEFDINPNGDSVIGPGDDGKYVVFQDAVLFPARGVNGVELYSIVGGNLHAFDLFPGEGDSNPLFDGSGLKAGRMLATDSQLYFEATTSTGEELFRTDGVTTEQLTFFDAQPRQIIAFGDRQVFRTDTNQLFVLDGKEVSEIAQLKRIGEMFEYNGMVYYSDYGQLGWTDGETTYRMELRQRGDSGPKKFVEVGGDLLFLAASDAVDVLFPNRITGIHRLTESGVELVIPESSFGSTYLFEDTLICACDQGLTLIKDGEATVLDLEGDRFSSFTQVGSDLYVFADADGNEQSENFLYRLTNAELGDFNANGSLDVADIDALLRAIAAGDPNAQFDIDDSGAVNQEDIAYWVHGLKKTWFGDADLDGEFTSSDLVNLFDAGEYEDDVEVNSGWAEGDWNGDAEFNSGDLVLAFQDGGFERGAGAALNPVPEPATAWLLAVAWMGMVTFRRYSG